MPGPGHVHRGGMTGTGVGATYDRDRDVLWLLDQAQITVAPDAKAAARSTPRPAPPASRAPTTTSGSRATAHVVADNRTHRRRRHHRAPDAGRREASSSMQLRGNSRIAGSRAPGAQSMAAQDIDLDLRRRRPHAAAGEADGESAVVQLPGDRRRAGQRIAGRDIDIDDGAGRRDGDQPERHRERRRSTCRRKATRRRRRIKAATLAAAGDGGRRAADGDVRRRVDYRETRAARGKRRRVDRARATSQRLDRPDQARPRRPRAGGRSAATCSSSTGRDDGRGAASAIYQVDQDRLDLSPVAERHRARRRTSPTAAVTVDARTIQMTLATQKLKADTDVRSVHGPQAGRRQGAAAAAQAPASAHDAAAVDAEAGPAGQRHRQPARLRRRDVARAPTPATRGCWQGETEHPGRHDRASTTRRATCTAPTATVAHDDDARRTSTRRPKPADARPRPIGTRRRLVYEDAKRLATYTHGTGRAPGRRRRRPDAATGSSCYLKEGGSELERAEADGNVDHVEARTARRTAST